MKIAFSKASGQSPNYAKYIDWIHTADPMVQYVDLALCPTVEEAVETLESCAGLVITGGPDVHPERYGKPEELPRCSIDAERDTLEFALYTKAKELKMPVLGVCRGAQVINVAEGGTLVVDVPTDLAAEKEHSRIDDEDSIHQLHVLAGSILTKITGEIDGEINSAHHQAVERPGEGLRVSAQSEDGVNEAIEWQDPTNRPFLLGVQWHPERMNYANPFSINIAQHFLFEAESYKVLMRREKKS